MRETDEGPRGDGRADQQTGKGERQLRRRGFLKAVIGGVGGPLMLRGTTWAAPGPGWAHDGEGGSGALVFSSVDPSDDDLVHVPWGYTHDVIARWGDPLFEGQDAFDLDGLTPEEQARRFGMNCDFNGFFPLDRSGARGLLCVNHEYPGGSEMFRDYERKNRPERQIAVEMAALGLSVIEVARDDDGAWRLVIGSPYNRRVTAGHELELSGPCAGHPWMQTAADPTGSRVLGTFANCSGGKTPWHTVLSGEENVNMFFGTKGDESVAVTALHAEYGVRPGWSVFRWERHRERFDVSVHPNEPNRFGWVVELDPYEPESVPKKRTALGRFKHEGANTALTDDGRVVVYMGDDERGQCVYKFVSEESFDPAAGGGTGSSGRGASGRDLLDHGVLYVARFDPDGSGRWLPLIPKGPLEGRSQAEILINARASAHILGATAMDRPEDIQVNPVNQRVYMVMTKDGDREVADHVNPRPKNRHGHILEVTENGGDLAATSFTWSHFLICGPAGSGARYAGVDPAAVNPVSCPDNIAFDGAGNLWIATDGQPKAQDTNDALYAVATAGPDRGLTRRFLTGPGRSEICGPEFTPDDRALFVNVQHPGEGRGIGEKKSSHWPDGGEHPPRASVIAVRRKDGGRVGS